MVAFFDALSPWFEIILTILGFASAIYPVARWIVNQFNKRQDRFEISIKNAIGEERKQITDTLEVAKEDMNEVKDSQGQLRGDIIRVDAKVDNIDNKLDKHIVWSSGTTNRMQTQIENNFNRLERNDNRIDNIYSGLTRRHEEQDAEIKENRSRVNEISDKLHMPKSVKLEINDQKPRTPYTPFKKLDPETNEEVDE